MAFKIGSNTAISNVPDILYTNIINAPATQAKLTRACSNGTFKSVNTSLSGSTLTILVG